VREAWANKAQIPGQVVAKFILSEDERTPQVEQELEEFGDIVFVREKTNYKSILFKTFYVRQSLLETGGRAGMSFKWRCWVLCSCAHAAGAPHKQAALSIAAACWLPESACASRHFRWSSGPHPPQVMEYAVTHYDVAYVLKTDDDAFINVAPMVEQLKLLCQNPGCQNERLYMGTMARHSEVMLQPGHKWNNAAFYNHTGLKQYPNYMMGGGYVIGGEVARVLVDIHARFGQCGVGWLLVLEWVWVRGVGGLGVCSPRSCTCCRSCGCWGANCGLRRCLCPATAPTYPHQSFKLPLPQDAAQVHAH
jgi:hypothetical protein